MSNNKISDESFVTVYGWMRTRLGLKTNALFLFALIYGYNYHTGNEFYGSIKYMQEWLGIGSDNTIRAALRLLCEEKHYILKRYEKIDTGIRVYYRINPDILPPKDGSINSLWKNTQSQTLPKLTEAAQAVAIISPSAFAIEAIQLLLDYIKSDTFSRPPTNPLELLKTVEVLILDDIDKINPSSWALGQLYDILNTRYANYRSTLFTSNHSWDELTKELSKKAPKDTHTAAAITDRIAGMCYSLTLEGESWRQKS